MGSDQNDPIDDKPIEDEPIDWRLLIDSARAGDEDSITMLWTCLRSYLLLLADRGLGEGLRQKIDASDIVQQSLIEAQRDLHNFHGNSEGELRTWLKRLVEHNLIDVSRLYRETERRDIAREVSLDAFHLPLQIQGTEKTPSSVLRRRERDEQMLRAIAALPERKRMIVEMRHRDRLGYDEISQRMNMTEAAVRKIWSRAIEEMRKTLANYNAQR